MIVCLGCRKIWPAGSVYCPLCQRSFGAALCPKGHPNPMGTAAMTCLVCNEGPLVPGVACLRFGWAVRILGRMAGLLVLVPVWRWSWHHACLLACWTLRVGVWTIAELFGVPERAVLITGESLLAGWIGLWAVSFVLPHRVAHPMRWVLLDVPRFLLRAALSLRKRPHDRHSRQPGTGQD